MFLKWEKCQFLIIASAAEAAPGGKSLGSLNSSGFFLGTYLLPRTFTIRSDTNIRGQGRHISFLVVFPVETARA
jgi:hypothetical protein